MVLFARRDSLDRSPRPRRENTFFLAGSPLKERKQGSPLMSMTDGHGAPNGGLDAWECVEKLVNPGIHVAEPCIPQARPAVSR